MTLTLAEAIQSLPILASARVVAGENGLQHSIRWTHIVDQPEVFSWVRAGDLLLTTAFALKDHPDSELAMVEQMAQKGLAGMLVSIGRYIDAVPPETITRADALNFPIVVIPWEVPLVEVTHAIHERIIRDEYQESEPLRRIQDLMQHSGLQGACQVVMLEIQGGMTPPDGWVQAARQFISDQRLRGGALEWGRRLLVVVNASANPAPEAFARLAVQHWSQPGSPLAAGISARFDDAASVQNACQQAIQALQVGAALGKGVAGVWSFERLGYLAWLHAAPPEIRQSNPYSRLIAGITRYDQENGTELLDTLEIYLTQHLNTSRAARELFIHRNSLLKRLDRIRQLWQVDFEDPYFMLNLQLAILDARLNQTGV